ncbi:hypothetical protein GGR39_003457 [Novosphingobium fluoreni]|uniref:Uncharacterized protein n=1 Tax=Novosphingobium fluoreni TaxID=1391222 RepID=A0A7W6FZQ8_9SPHN|nr:hypothetical protein [Novosphingobium fluoreni]
MDFDDVEVSVVEAAIHRGCDQCGGHWDGGRIVVRGDEVVGVTCQSCVDDREIRGSTSRLLH